MNTEPTAGFLEEEPGVRSMTRLTALMQCVGVLALALSLAAYLLTAEAPDSGVIAAIGAPLAALAGGIWGALKVRTGGEP